MASVNNPIKIEPERKSTVVDAICEDLKGIVEDIKKLRVESAERLQNGKHK